MKTIEKAHLDFFLELPLVAKDLLEINEEYTCIHDDNDGNDDQCLKITLKEDSPNSRVFYLQSPIQTGLRFRTSGGGGLNLAVHNAIKVLIYSLIRKEYGPFIPGLEPKKPNRRKTLKHIRDLLEGVIILPPEVFENKKILPNYFFNALPNLDLAISVDSDAHIIAYPNTDFKKIVRSKTTYWNPEPFVFCLGSNCNRAVYNSLILLAFAVKESKARNYIISP
jgi:hypothetical protein